MARFARIVGFVRLRSVHRPGRPGQGLPGEEEDLTPEWGVPEGEHHPEVEPPEPEDLPDPPGVWPPLEGPDFPMFPIAPEDGPWEPGQIWPPMRPPHGSITPPGAAPGQPLPKRLFFAACRLPEYGWKWIVVDLNAIHRPDKPAGGVGGRPPDTRPQPPERH